MTSLFREARPKPARSAETGAVAQTKRSPVRAGRQVTFDQLRKIRWRLCVLFQRTNHFFFMLINVVVSLRVVHAFVLHCRGSCFQWISHCNPTPTRWFNLYKQWRFEIARHLLIRMRLALRYAIYIWFAWSRYDFLHDLPFSSQCFLNSVSRRHSGDHMFCHYPVTTTWVKMQIFRTKAKSKLEKIFGAYAWKRACNVHSTKQKRI